MLFALFAAAALHPGVARIVFPQQSQVVYAIVGEHLLTGVSDPSVVDDRGLVTLKSADGSSLACKVGYGYQRGGLASFVCSDGSKFRVPYQGYSPWSGTGGGTDAGRRVSLCYGFQPKEAARRLRPPAGYAVEVEAGRLVLKRSAT
jgi:hypothetical protein